ncbi:MAG TPA: hypothetical protein VLM85_03590 [Polyangiaceae bacterium]|nr:hypothetical protein [Polyangiaceae bacterium]
MSRWLALAAALAALTLPTLAFADDHEGRRESRRDDAEIVQLRADIAHDRFEIARDARMHRWQDVRRERRDLERDQRRLAELMRHRGGYRHE